MIHLRNAVRKVGSADDNNSGQIAISDIELDWLTRIHSDIRNQFVDFEPMGMSVEVSGVPRIGQLVARIIKEIHSCGWAFRRLDTTKKNKMALDLEHLAEASWPVNLGQ